MKKVNDKMGKCSICDENEVMPFHCKFCGMVFCRNHRLPENHNCIGLSSFRENRSKDIEKWVYDPFNKKYQDKTVKRPSKKPLASKVNGVFSGPMNTTKILYIIIGVMVTLIALKSLGLL